MLDRIGYRPPASELPGAKTFVHPDSVPEGHTKDQALPTPPWTRSKPIQYLHYNVPSGVPEKELWRVPNKPGEQSPSPKEPSRTMLKRRPGVDASEDTNAAVNGPVFPTQKTRQHDQRGQARMYYKKYYQSHRGDITRKMKKWYIKHKNWFNYKKDQKRRRLFPERFERRPGGGEDINKNRAQKWRNEQKTASWAYNNPANLLHIETDREGWMLGIDSDTGLILVGFDQTVETFPIETFFDEVVFMTCEDIDSAMQDLDAVFEWSDENSLIERVACRYSEMLYEKRPPDMDKDTKWDRGKNRPILYHQHIPGDVSQDYYVWDNPGSAKVIPQDSDLVNNKAAGMKTAVRISEIRNLCDSSIHVRSKKVKIRLARVDSKNLTWTFNVTGSKDRNYQVKVRVLPKGHTQNIKKMDVLVSCSCPFWQWQGPEYHAKQHGYLLGKPQGTAASPDIKDPHGQHGACKHVIAVLERVAGFSLPRGHTAPEKAEKRASLRLLAACIQNVSFSEYHLIDVVARRYGQKIAVEGGDHAVI